MQGNEQLAAMQAELVHRTEKRKKKRNANENKRAIAIKGMQQYFLVIENSCAAAGFQLLPVMIVQQVCKIKCRESLCKD